jgi:spermidine synthase
MEKEVIYNYDDKFRIIDYIDNNKKLRALASSEVIYSVTNREGDKNDLVIDYLKLYDLPCVISNKIKNTLVLGAGCFTYPKYYISRYNSSMDAVELDENIIKMAFDYFYLNELYDEFDKDKERLKIYNTDAYSFVFDCNKKYDYILFDIFDNNNTDNKFFSEEYVGRIKKLLNNDSFLGINYILNKEKSEDFKALFNILNKYFKNISFYTVNDTSTFSNNDGNIFLLCSDDFIDIELDKKYLKLSFKDLI